MYVYFLIGLGGALGSMARHLCSMLALSRFGDAFPWGTVFINIAGSLAIGFFARLNDPAARLSLSPDIRMFLMAGVCGGFTTFSAFSLQTLDLLQAGEMMRAGANIALSVVCCVAATWAGQWLAGAYNASPSN